MTNWLISSNTRTHILFVILRRVPIIMLFLLSLSAICALILVFIIYYLVPIFVQCKKLRRDYQNIPSLPLSRIPFVGNLHQFDSRQHVFSRLLLQMAAECQQQGKGLFCLWYSIWPMIFACTGHSLAVRVFHFIFIKRFLFLDFRRLSTIVNN